MAQVEVSGCDVECRDIHGVVTMVTECRDPISQPPVGDILGSYSMDRKRYRKILRQGILYC